MRSEVNCVCVPGTGDRLCVSRWWRVSRGSRWSGYAQLSSSLIPRIPLIHCCFSILTSNRADGCWEAYSLPVSELFIEPMRGDANERDGFQRGLRAALLHLLWPLFSSHVRSLAANGVTGTSCLSFSLSFFFYQYSPLSFSNLSFSSPIASTSLSVCLSVCLSPPLAPPPSSPVFPRPAHLLRDRALCLRALAGRRTDGPCVFW